MTKFDGIHKRFDYIPNRIESGENLNTGTKIQDYLSKTGQRSHFFYFRRKNGSVGSYKQGWLANRKHTYIFFWPKQNFECKIVNIFLPINLNIDFGCSKEPSH